MPKIRVFALANQLGLRSKALVEALKELGVDKVSPATSIDKETAIAVQELLAEQAKQAREAAEKAKAEAQKEAAVEAEEEEVQAQDEFVEKPVEAEAVEVAEGEAEKPTTKEKEKEREEERERREREEERQRERYLRSREEEQRRKEEEGLRELERRIAELEAQEEEERERRAKAGEVVPLPKLAQRPTGEKPEGAVEVPPVVTVLGHVDHGKTTLLDALRETDVVSGESGGITQHIGASEIETEDGARIVFLDTPGHEAFTGMRARGATVTDMCILVVAADDGVMPQTVEAINHAKAAEVPIIVAVNKVDLPTADPDRVKQQLLEYELVPEEWGGDTIVVEISALERENLDELVEMILLVGEVEELWADPDGEFAGIVVESSVDTSQGTVCTVLVRNGTLRVGDSVLAGTAHGRIRRLRNWKGRSVDEMPPGSPVEVVGLTGIPEAGEIMTRADSLKDAREVAEERQEEERQREMSEVGGISLRQILGEVKEEGPTPSLNVVLKGDVWGSVQALEANLVQLDQRLEGLRINILSTGVGDITESDTILAKASEAIIIGFHVDADGSVLEAAENEGVEIRTYNVIYEILEDIERALLGLVEPEYEKRKLGEAEVLELFRISRLGVVAGSRVMEGVMRRGAEMRVSRDGQEIFRGTLESLRRFDRDVREVEAPNECGILTGDWSDWEVGDQIEAWEEVELERALPLKEREQAT